MAFGNIQVNPEAYWKQQAQVKDLEIETLRARVERAERMNDDLLKLKNQELAPKNLEQLQCDLEDNRNCTSDELDLLHDFGDDTHLTKKAKDECKMDLHCKVQRLQKYKWILSSACEAELTHLIWLCQSEDAAAGIDALVSEIKADIAACPNLNYTLKKKYEMVLAGCG